MNRRQALAPSSLMAANPSVSTLIGTGSRGYSDSEVNNPYGLVFGPDRALYFCDLDNQRIRRLDLKTHRTTAVAGNGQRAYGGDGGAATAAALNMPHEIQFDSAAHMYIAERDNHVVRKIEANTGIISTFAGTGMPGFSGDGGPAARAQLRQPHSIAVDPRGKLLICDIGNHRIRQVDFSTGMIGTYGGTGEHQPTPDGAPVKTAPLNGPRTMRSRRRSLSRPARRQRHLPHRVESGDDPSSGWHRRARLFGRWRAGPPGETRGAQGARL